MYVQIPFRMRYLNTHNERFSTLVLITCNWQNSYLFSRILKITQNCYCLQVNARAVGWKEHGEAFKVIFKRIICFEVIKVNNGAIRIKNFVIPISFAGASVY